ncbi:MAG: hypothetical protein NC543_00525 [bacterium]|nr:hypothetical protein [bacterium]MCM1374947.1 hypothetical protein [Muribaculum sp.]
MKKKLVIFGLAGMLLFSGFSVYAATNGCGHPATTTSYPTERRDFRKCSEHYRCEVYDLYGLEVVECHSCFQVVIIKETKLDTYHIPSDKYE